MQINLGYWNLQGLYIKLIEQKEGIEIPDYEQEQEGYWFNQEGHWTTNQQRRMLNFNA